MDKANIFGTMVKSMKGCLKKINEMVLVDKYCLTAKVATLENGLMTKDMDTVSLLCIVNKSISLK